MSANGAPDALGGFRVVEYEPANGTHFKAVGGDSFIAAIEFSNPVQAKALLVYGDASQLGSPHRYDQLELFAHKKLRPVWRTRKEVEANTMNRTSLKKSVVGHN